MPRTSRRSGLALVLVLTVVMALAIIATPFVLSMIEQERTAVTGRAWQQAFTGAEGVRNFAITRVLAGTDGIERHGNPPGTPYLDTRSETFVDLRDARLRNAGVLDGKGNLWGVIVQDEQGKVNSLSAPGPVLQNLRRVVDPRVVDPKDYLTIYSSRPGRWIHPQRIRDLGTFTNQIGSITGLQLDSVVHLAQGAKVRISKPGLPAIEAEVVQNGRFFFGIEAISTSPSVGVNYANGLVEVEARHPVNVNTARRETLIAMLEGLALAWPATMPQGQKSAVLSRSDAMDVADAIRDKGFQTWDAFVQAVLGTQVDDLAKCAVILNAVDPTNFLLATAGGQGSGTLPFCFTSCETITVLARSSVNNPQGVPVSGAGFREVIDYAPATTLTLHVENEYDFDRFLGPPRFVVNGNSISLGQDAAVTMQMAGWPGAYNGYPFGARIMTFPTAIASGQPADMTLKPQPAQTENYLSMRTDRDVRGGGQWINNFNHFDAEVDGLKLVNAVHSPGTWDTVFSRNPNQFGPDPTQNFPDVSAGGTEFWIRFDGSVPAALKLFDIREGDKSNRISLEIEAKDIVYRITDGTVGRQNAQNFVLDKGWSEIRAVHPFVADTWYHIAIYWKGTRYGHMLLMIDGFVPTGAKWRCVDDESLTDCSTELINPLTIPTDPNDLNQTYISLPMKNTGWLQKPASWPSTEPFIVPLLIGAEVFHYEPDTGMAARGQRATAFQDHVAGAKVTLFGYASRIRDLDVNIDYGDGEPPVQMRFDFLPRAQAVTTRQFGAMMTASINGPDDIDADGMATELAMATTTGIKFTTNDTAAWPQPGFIRIQNEAIYYEKITVQDATNGTFDNCTRGAEATIAADHPAGSMIEMWGIAVDMLDANIPLNTALMIQDELFWPVRTTTNTTDPSQINFWVGVVVNPGMSNAIARPLRRDPVAGPQVPHPAGERIIPGFAIRESDPGQFRWNAARGDLVTVVDSNDRKETHQVGAVRNQPNPPDTVTPNNPSVVFNDPSRQLAWLKGNVTQDVTRDDLHARILKWPSGELIGVRCLEVNNLPPNYGPFTATIDEVKNFASPKGHFRMIAPADATQQQINVPDAAGMGVNQNNPCGVVLAGEEVIGFAGFAGNQSLHPAKRGWLNSTAQVHNTGDLMFNLSFLPVSALSNALTPEHQLIATKQRLKGLGNYSRGYALIDQEVVGFESVGPGGRELDTLCTWDGAGLFRGMFGTQKVAHAQNALVYGIPFRYWDGYKAGQFDNRMAYFGTAHTVRGARWQKFDFDTQVIPADPLVQVHAFVRGDGLGDPWTPALGGKSAVWHFTKNFGNPMLDEQGAPFIGYRGEAGQIESRIFVEYRPGAYWPNHAWKKTMRLKEIKIDYDRDNRVLFHEER